MVTSVDPIRAIPLFLVTALTLSTAHARRGSDRLTRTAQLTCKADVTRARNGPILARPPTE
jgi:hypothetical protein